MDKRKLTWEQIFSALYLLTIFSAIGVLSFSVSLHIEKVIFCLMFISFLVVLVQNCRNKPGEVWSRFRAGFQSARFLYVAFGLYLVWDVILLFYSKDLSLAFGKLPQYAGYLLLLPTGIYFCSNKKRVKALIFTVACVGSAVSVGALIIYFVSRRPIYFQRLSTATDYNVFSTILVISLIFGVVWLLYENRLAFWKRLGILVVLLAVNMPVLYLAGSRRMMIMLPYFLLFAVVYEAARSFFQKPVSVRRGTERLMMIVFCAVFYMAASSLAGPFSQLGAEKESAWKKYEAGLIQQGQTDLSDGALDSSEESTISKVIESIDSGEMSNKRKLIYTVALRELDTYSPTELLFGKGASYDMYLYDHTTNEALLSAYKYDSGDRPASGWMSAHNFVLADLLNGGLLKLALSLALIGGILAVIIGILRRDSRCGLLLMLPFALVVCNNFISGAYGFLNDIFFITVLTLLCSIRKLQHEREEIRE